MNPPHTPNPLEQQVLAQLLGSLSTRTLAHFAQEARLDGESLKDALERYDIDYAWHVLGSERTQEAALQVLRDRLDRDVTPAQKAWLQDLLQTAAAGQAPDLLMSFDNDVAATLADCLSDRWAQA